MTTLTIRNIDEQVKSQLRMQAAQHGRSMEQEVREILRAAVQAPTQGDFAQRIQQRFAKLAADDVVVPARRKARVVTLPE